MAIKGKRWGMKKHSMMRTALLRSANYNLLKTINFVEWICAFTKNIHFIPAKQHCEKELNSKINLWNKPNAYKPNDTENNVSTAYV